MKFLSTVLMLSCCGMFSLYAVDSKYNSPALHKVTFETPHKHAPVELIRGGKIRFVIVCDREAEKKARVVGNDNPIGLPRESLTKSACFLVKNLNRCFNASVAVLPPDSPELAKYPVKIYLGKSIHTDKYGIDITKMPPDGFKIMTVPDGIIIAGRDGSLIPGSYHWNDLSYYAENGTVGATVDFLERFLGMRFYYPGLGVIAPKIKNLAIDPVAYTGRPKYLTRLFGNVDNAFHAPETPPRQIGLATTREWPWAELPNDQGDFRIAWNQGSRPSRFLCGEAPHPYIVAKAFPDKLDVCFYRDKKGKLYQSLTQYTANYFDLSNMEFSKLLADAYYNFYTSKGKVTPLWYNSYCPNPEYMYFGPVDAIEAIENERTADLPKRHDVYSTMSEVNGRFYFDLASRLEKMVPGKKIAFMAYQNYLAAPEHIKKFPDNVRIMACTGTPLFIRDKASENFWRKICTDWNRKLQDKVVLYPYDAAFHLEGGFAHALRGYFENEFLQKVAPFSNDTVIYPCCYFRWDYYYSLYLMSRAYWNPDFDRDAVLDEQWKLLYGPAAPALKEFYEYVIDRWIKYYIPCATIRHRSIAGVDYDTLHKKTYPPEVLQKMRKMLEKARSLVDKNSIEGKRLTFFIMPWERIMDGAMAYGMAKPPLPCRAEFTETNLKIDGRLDEPCWKKASAIPFRSAYYGEIKKNLPLPQAKIIWSQEGLYVGIFNPGPFKKKGNLWDEDNFEFFISPGLTKNKLFQFVCSSSGLHEDYFKSFEPPRELDPAWKCRDFRKAIVSDVQGWSCEIFIPYAALECTAPVAGDSWLFNWVNNRTDSETTSAAPTMGNNRNINFYGKLYFAGNCE